MAHDKRVLQTVKTMLGLPEEQTVFDAEILLHINSAMSVVNQLGVGPEAGITVDQYTLWIEIFDDPRQNHLVSYVYYKVSLVFDPPGTSYAIQSFEKMAKEAEWRLNVQVESEVNHVRLS